MVNEIIKDTLQEYAQNLVHKKIIEGYSIHEDDGVRIELRGKLPDQTVVLDVTKTLEVFFLRIGNKYTYHTIEYDEVEKIKTVQELLQYASLYLNRKYFERLYENKDHLLQSEIFIYDRDKDQPILSIKSKITLWGLIQKLFGVKQKIIYPQQSDKTQTDNL